MVHLLLKRLLLARVLKVHALIVGTGAGGAASDRNCLVVSVVVGAELGGLMLTVGVVRLELGSHSCRICN
jgi:hypothetical protein